MIIESLLLLAPAIGASIAVAAMIASAYVIGSSIVDHFRHRKVV